jgi:hypothetical protein
VGSASLRPCSKPSRLAWRSWQSRRVEARLLPRAMEAGLRTTLRRGRLAEARKARHREVPLRAPPREGARPLEVPRGRQGRRQEARRRGLSVRTRDPLRRRLSMPLRPWPATRPRSGATWAVPASVVVVVAAAAAADLDPVRSSPKRRALESPTRSVARAHKARAHVLDLPRPWSHSQAAQPAPRRLRCRLRPSLPSAGFRSDGPGHLVKGVSWRTTGSANHAALE